VAKVAAKDREGPNEGPTIGMQLGRGHIELCEQLSFEVVETDSLTDALEHRLVKEWLPVIRAVINTDMVASCAGENRDVGVVYPPEGLS